MPSKAMDNYIRDLLHASSASHVQTRVVSDNARATVLGYITEALEISQRSNESDDDYSPIINRDHRKRSSDRRERSRWASAAATSDAASPMSRPRRRRSLTHNPTDREGTDSILAPERRIVSTRLPSHLRRTPYDFSMNTNAGNGSTK